MLFLAAFLGVVLADTDGPQITALPPNGNTFLLRVETEAIGGTFNLQAPPGNTSVNQITVEFRVNGVVTVPVHGGVLQPIFQNGLPAVSSLYQTVSFPASGAETTNPTVTVCFNNSILFVQTEMCSSALVPIGGGANSPFTRTIVTLVQHVGAISSSCACIGGGSTCNCGSQTTQQPSSFSVTTTQESLAQRLCFHAPLFARGIHQCPVFIQRTGSLNVSAPSDLSETVQLAQPIAPSTDTTTFFNGNNGILLPRDIPYVLSVDTQQQAVSGSSRVYEALVSDTAANVVATDTFFVMIVNAAHRETATANLPAGSGFTFANDASGATVFVQDSAGTSYILFPV
jgi:hypothetical protein